MRLLVMGMLGFLLGCCLPLSQGRAADTIIIAAFGDSLFAGYGINVAQSIPAQLEQRLSEAGYHVKIINDGVSGDTTSGGVARQDFVLQQKPSIVIIELGSNDLLRALPPTDIRTNLDRIMARFQEAKIKMILVGQKAPLMNLGVQYSTAYNAIFSELAGKYHAVLYPSILEGAYGNPDLMQPDGLHPNAKGAALIADKFVPFVKKLL